MIVETADGRKQLLERLLRERLLYATAQTSGIDLDQKMELYLARLRRNLMIKQYLVDKKARQTASAVGMRAALAANPEKFTTSEKRLVRHILVAREEELVKGLEQQFPMNYYYERLSLLSSLSQ